MSDYIRCPICLFTMRRDPQWPADIQLQCIGCRRTFKLGDALGGSLAPNAGIVSDTAPNESESITLKALLIACGSIVMACLLVVANGEAMRDHTFFPIYGIIIGVATFTQWFIRATWRDNQSVSFLAAALVVAVGATRFVHGFYFLGMKNFGFLVFMALVGTLIQFVRSHHFAGTGRGGCGGHFGGCSGGGGCGGGCGGGGCGGCGS